jgi:hypothetical protein
MNYTKLLEMNSFSTWYIFLEVGKPCLFPNMSLPRMMLSEMSLAQPFIKMVWHVKINAA